MKTKIVYYDETGDDGNNTKSSDTFTFTGVYMFTEDWQSNFKTIKSLRKEWKLKYNFPSTLEFHTTPFFKDKDPYRTYNWTIENKREMLQEYIWLISKLKIQTVNVVIDKTKTISTQYDVMENALKYNIQQIDNISKSDWNYLVISDKGRVNKMRKTARAINLYNSVNENSGNNSRTSIQNMIEDIMEKDSAESYFIQISDFISYIVHLYFRINYLHLGLPSRVGRLVDASDFERILDFFLEK